MGTVWSVRLVAPAEGTTGIEAAIQAVLDGVVGEMSHWEPGSDLSRFNRAEIGRWQPLPRGFSEVLGAALAVAEASGGAFDPAMGALADLWGFGPSGPRVGIPDADVIAAVKTDGAAIEYDVAGRRARRVAPAALDFSGIAKGYAVDAIGTCLRGRGVEDFLVEIGGELLGAGIKPDGQPWWVDLEPVPGVALPGLRVALHGCAVATSGDYRRTFSHAGRHYAHTLDPRTGVPLANGVASVTLLHPQCMLADAWATALTVLGPEQGLAAAEREGLAARIVVRDGREILSTALRAMLA
jgi:thiamine biosynthesis lipoprotein